jgi:hypothetical protein
MGFYSRRHYRDLAAIGCQQSDDGLGPVRIRERQLREKAYNEMVERFAPLTPEKMVEALAWMETRIKELLRCA